MVNCTSHVTERTVVVRTDDVLLEIRSLTEPRALKLEPLCPADDQSITLEDCLLEETPLDDGCTVSQLLHVVWELVQDAKCQPIGKQVV